MSATRKLQRRGGGAFEMNLMQRLENSSRPQQRPKNNKRKAQNPPPNPPAPKRQRNNNGLSVARPQRAAAAAYSTGQHTGEAKVYRNGLDSCRIVHRELLTSVSGTEAFTIPNTFALNPGLVASFPWLSTQAQAWERYRFNKLKYCYYTRTGSSTAGSLMMAPDFDAADAPPISEAIASSYDHCEEDAPWKDISCILPKKSLMGDMKEKYIRNGALSPNQDIKTYDAGNLFVCTVDGVDATGWGKIWVEYDVTLFNPQVPSGGFQATGALKGATSMTAATPFGTAPESTGPIQISANGLTVTLRNAQVGQELFLFFSLTGTGITNVNVTPGTGINQRIQLADVENAAGTNGCFGGTFRVLAPNPTLTLTVTATTVTFSSFVAAALAPIPTF